ncbi:MAG: hypothetical protein C4334_03945 [Pyrinomonas sp.]|uniref:rhodanese-like domain-containing protein n=1 Tax=Pyrinomonas sp. TaxID=2080306 RepID=UPI003329A788
MKRFIACGFFVALFCAPIAFAQQGEARRQKPTRPSEVERIAVEELKEKIAKGEPVVILDVRAGAAYDSSDQTIKGARRIAPDEIEKRLSELPKDREIVTFCT